MKKQSVTLVQVAKKAGVSVMTASRAMSGEGYVSEETRNKVQAAARELVAAAQPDLTQVSGCLAVGPQSPPAVAQSKSLAQAEPAPAGGPEC